MFRGRVSINKTASATSAASINPPLAIASSSLALGQPLIGAVITVRKHRPYPNAVLDDLAADGVRKGLNCVFQCCIDRLSNNRRQACDRTGKNDIAGLSFHHMREISVRQRMCQSFPMRDRTARSRHAAPAPQPSASRPSRDLRLPIGTPRAVW